jgi:hypothetical protein
MTSQSGPIYEVTIFVAPDDADDCDLWLEDYLRRALREPGVVNCSVFSTGDDSQGRRRRVCLHSFSTDETLDEFLNGTASEFDALPETGFGASIKLENRVLREDRSQDLIPGQSQDCLNCGTRLKGQYCGNCGQRSRSRLISLWELVSDAFGDLFEIDSRVWQTLIPLLIRPGRLTHDYLQGRRARYMPPFRMYLVLSLLFFVVAFFDPREDLGLLFVPQPELATEEAAEEAAETKQEILDELAEQGINIDDDLPEEFEIDDDGFNIQFNGREAEVNGDCDVDASDLKDLPDWVARRMTVERLQHVCESTHQDNGRAFLDNLVDNIPAALIVLLPLMAFVLKALYPLSKRYYVEHLLFFVHFHAFFFLILSLQILAIRLAELLHIPEAIAILAVVLASFYVPIYLFVAMRRVYGQGRIITFIKYIGLVTAYLLGFSATMAAAVATAAFSV